MSAVIVVEAGHPCDRCGHPMYRHAGPERKSICLHPGCRPIKRGDPPLCDGYVPATEAAKA